MTWNTEEILKEIEYNNGHLPVEALKQVIAQKDVFIPELLKILEHTCQNAEEIAEKDNYFAHIYALFLLAQFREKGAYPLVVNLIGMPSEILENLLGDVITEGLQNILASVCDGNIVVCQGTVLLSER